MKPLAAEYDFGARIIEWGKSVARDLPWQGENNVYLVWIAEVILQQTRAQQGRSYYERFIRQFPTVQKLATADQAEVLKAWEGLGYYTRVVNLHKTARIITNEHDGVFPDTHDDLIKLPGIGPYTAAAIASFVYGEKKAVLDGNVFRVLSRHFGIETPADSQGGRKVFRRIADRLLPDEGTAHYNQAIMDLGALVCTPRSPDCPKCPVKLTCKAHKLGTMQIFPVKQRSLRKKNRYFQFFVMRHRDTLVLEKRHDRDIWRFLHQFPLLETGERPRRKLLEAFLNARLGSKWEIKDNFYSTQVLTHQIIHARFHDIVVHTCPDTLPHGYFWTEIKNLPNFAYPKIINSYIRNRLLST